MEQGDSTQVSEDLKVYAKLTDAVETYINQVKNTDDFRYFAMDYGSANRVIDEYEAQEKPRDKPHYNDLVQVLRDHVAEEFTRLVEDKKIITALLSNNVQQQIQLEKFKQTHKSQIIFIKSQIHKPKAYANII